jgi:predicted Zn-dependent protease
MMEKVFKALSDRLFSDLNPGEILQLSLKGESSQFIRLTQSKVRQTGVVKEADLKLRLIHGDKTCSGSVTIGPDTETSYVSARALLDQLRTEIPQLPADPYIVQLVGEGSSRTVKTGQGLPFEDTVDRLLPVMQGIDLVGIWAAGSVYYGAANSLGQFHWFETDSYSLDFSLVNEDHKMVKGTFAGSDWDQEAYERFIATKKEEMNLMAKPAVQVRPGSYRTWFAPAAVSDFLGMFSWNGISEAAIRQGHSSFSRMKQEDVKLSTRFSLAEDFTNGMVPRFNSLGEVAPEKLVLIDQGNLKHTLVSSRTASEYNLESNYAETEEFLRAPSISPGHLNESDVLNQLDTGLYISNIHYLNWSDNSAGRITGLTRYACFWVEKGEIVGPINTMRFDDTFYRFFGTELEAVGSEIKVVPDVMTYEGRNTAATLCPGILVNSFTLTL